MNDDVAYRGGGGRSVQIARLLGVQPRRRDVLDPDLRLSHSDHRAGDVANLGCRCRSDALDAGAPKREDRHGDRKEERLWPG
jgi:hypothetical protein